MLAGLLVGCPVDIGGTGYHVLPPLGPLPERYASCTHRGSADEVWPLFWPAGAEAAIREFERDVQGRWSVTESCSARERAYEIVVGPSQRSDFALLNGGCAELAYGEVPGIGEGGFPQDWDLVVTRDGGLEVGSIAAYAPHRLGWAQHPADGLLHYSDGRWQAGACRVVAQRVAP